MPPADPRPTTPGPRWSACQTVGRYRRGWQSVSCPVAPVGRIDTGGRRRRLCFYLLFDGLGTRAVFEKAGAQARFQISPQADIRMATSPDELSDGDQSRVTGSGSVTCRSRSLIFHCLDVSSWPTVTIPVVSRKRPIKLLLQTGQASINRVSAGNENDKQLIIFVWFRQRKWRAPYPVNSSHQHSANQSD